MNNIINDGIKIMKQIYYCTFPHFNKRTKESDKRRTKGLKKMNQANTKENK